MSASNRTVKYLYQLILTCWALFLIGCTGFNSSNKNDVSDGFEPHISSSSYLAKAQVRQGDTKVNYQFLAIRALLNERNLAKAEETLLQIPYALKPQLQQERLLAQASIALAKSQRQEAINFLNQISENVLSQPQKSRYYQFLINTTNQEDTLTQLRLYVLLEQVSNAANRQTVIDNSWRLLSQLNMAKIDQILIYSDDLTLTGWLELARMYAINKQQYHANLSLLHSDLNTWKLNFPKNPYNRQMPSQLSGSSQPVNHSNIALLLPLSGQAQVFGNAVLTGFKAAMQQDPSSTPFQVYDTNKQPIASLLSELQQNGTSVVVGPLLKNDVVAMQQHGSPFPQLALNIPENGGFANSVCYFSLAPEDDAQQGANYMWSKGVRQPLVIAPQSSLGKRSANAFENQWAQNSGAGALVQYYDGQHDLKNSINIRKGISLEGDSINPYRPATSDYVDAVYVIGSQNELALIRSMIEIKMAGSSRFNAIYATSRSHVSNTSPDALLELEGVKMSDIPLLTGQYPAELREAIKEMGGDYNLVRLYAFGMDVWKLVKNLNEVRSLPGYSLAGYTGQLTSNYDCVVQRQTSWLEYRQGRIVAIY